MELWIRSQEHSKVRRLLINTKNISYLEIDDINAENHLIIFKDINMKENELENWNCVLGIYNTWKRAEEVLDEIQYKINDVANMTDEYTINCIYEMPKE